MALDITIEIFACKLFDEVLQDTDSISINREVSLTYAEEYLINPDYYVHCNANYAKAVFCRLCFFGDIYSEEIRRNLSKILLSKTDFYEYFLSVCHDTDLFEGLTIFERVFATCAFVVIMSFECNKEGFKEVIESAYLCWAMYFDKYSTEFYSKGGWNELERVANSYSKLFAFLDFYEEWYKPTLDFLHKVARAVNNYHNFKYATQFCHFTLHTKDWIKYNRESYFKKDAAVFPPKGCPSSKEEAEKLLRELRLFCDFGQLSAHYAELSRAKEELAYKKHTAFILKPAPIDGITPSTEVNPKNIYAEAQADSTNSILVEDSSSDVGAQCCLPVPIVSSSRLPLNGKLNAMCEADYSPTSCNSIQVGSLSHLCAAADYIEGKRNDMHAKSSASSSACTSNNFKLQSESSFSDCEQEYCSENLETFVSFLRETLNLQVGKIGSNAGNIRETRTLELSPLPIHKKIKTLDEQTSGGKIQLQQEKNIQNPANMMLNRKGDITSGTDCIQRNNTPVDFALLKKIDEPLDTGIVLCEESSQQQNESNTQSSLTMIESISDHECSKNITENERLNALYEADYSPANCNSIQVGSLSDLCAAAEYIEGKRYDIHANSGASSSVCTSNNLKIQSVSFSDCEQEYFSENLETRIASFLRKTLNVPVGKIGSNAGNTRETRTLELSPLPIHKKNKTLDEQTSGSKIKLQQEKNILNPANMMSNRKGEITSGTDSIQLNNTPVDFALIKKIDEPLDTGIVFCEESGQQQHKSNSPSSLTTMDSVFDDECSKNMIDEDKSKTNDKPSSYKCAETTLEGNKKDQLTGNTCNAFQENTSISMEVESSSTVGASKKKKKRKKAKTKKLIQPSERESNDVKDLLRMILVLGDKNGIAYVCSTLQGADKAESSKPVDF